MFLEIVPVSRGLINQFNFILRNDFVPQSKLGVLTTSRYYRRHAYMSTVRMSTIRMSTVRMSTVRMSTVRMSTVRMSTECASH